jgi:hypothetical protein
MAAWRFYNNPRIAFHELVEPLQKYTRQRLAATRAPVVLLMHDWCKLSYPGLPPSVIRRNWPRPTITGMS